MAGYTAGLDRGRRLRSAMWALLRTSGSECLLYLIGMLGTVILLLALPRAPGQFTWLGCLLTIPAGAILIASIHVRLMGLLEGGCGLRVPGFWHLLPDAAARLALFVVGPIFVLAYAAGFGVPWSVLIALLSLAIGVSLGLVLFVSVAGVILVMALDRFLYHRYHFEMPQALFSSLAPHVFSVLLAITVLLIGYSWRRDCRHWRLLKSAPPLPVMLDSVTQWIVSHDSDPAREPDSSATHNHALGMAREGFSEGDLAPEVSHDVPAQGMMDDAQEALAPLVSSAPDNASVVPHLSGIGAIDALSPGPMSVSLLVFGMSLILGAATYLLLSLFSVPGAGILIVPALALLWLVYDYSSMQGLIDALGHAGDRQLTLALVPGFPRGRMLRWHVLQRVWRHHFLVAALVGACLVGMTVMSWLTSLDDTADWSLWQVWSGYLLMYVVFGLMATTAVVVWYATSWRGLELLVVTVLLTLCQSVVPISLFSTNLLLFAWPGVLASVVILAALWRVSDRRLIHLLGSTKRDRPNGEGIQ